MLYGLPIIMSLVLGPAQGAAAKRLPAGPLEFRCNNMQILTEPNRAICLDDVVVRRGDLIVCCQRFEGFAAEDWGWQRFTCSKQVRAWRHGETMWAEEAELVLATNNLTLTGRPRLQRGKSLVEFTRVVVDVKQDHARGEKPRGVIQAADSPSPPEADLPLEGPLPDTCPVPEAPAR